MSRPLELLHVDLMGATRMKSLGGKRYIMGGKRYIMVVLDDFLNTLGWNSLERNRKHVRRWRNFAKGFKMKRGFQSSK